MSLVRVAHPCVCTTTLCYVAFVFDWDGVRAVLDCKEYDLKGYVKGRMPPFAMRACAYIAASSL